MENLFYKIDERRVILVEGGVRSMEFYWLGFLFVFEIILVGV